MSKTNLYLIGRGDANLSDNGHYSDFFWVINSSFDFNRIYYDYKKSSLAQGILSCGVKLVDGFYTLYDNPEFKDSNLTLCKKRGKDIEEKELCRILKQYNNEINLYYQFFYENNIKIYFTWHKFNSNHLAMGSAIKKLGGVSVYWPTSFDGLPFYDSVCNFDIIFSYSNFNALNDVASNSKFKYNIIVGYIRDYATPLLARESILIRKKLELCGVKKTVFVVDENGLEDDRWHTGADLQKDNYRYILEKVLITPWLGVIFKPKVPKTLFERLGDVSYLLAKAEKTGRCIILKNEGHYTPPPLLAGLSSDLCIHAHLSAGTVALECALAGIPTLLIDREGCPFSKLHELPKNKVVFSDWPKTIDAMMNYFTNPDKDSEFGNWESIIDELDPYRDGKAAYRVGVFLDSIIHRLDAGDGADDAMDFAVREFASKWGEDKIISFNE